MECRTVVLLAALSSTLACSLNGATGGAGSSGGALDAQSTSSGERYGGWARHQANTCTRFAGESGSCLMRFKGPERDACEVCREGKSCFLGVKDPSERALCEAYRESKSCFLAIRDPVDRGWCEYLKEGKSCFLSLSGDARAACEKGVVPAVHAFWVL